jgi:hypothetical protein
MNWEIAASNLFCGYHLCYRMNSVADTQNLFANGTHASGGPLASATG